MPPHQTHHDPEPRKGLARPRAPLDELSPLAKRRPASIALQALGALLSLALLAWAASLALTSQNRESLQLLADASPLPVAAAIALALLSVACNGAIFQIILAHTHKLTLTHVTAVTAIATLVSYAPFKLSLVVRTLIHRRRDRLTYRTLIAWFAAVAALSILIIAPATLATVWRPSLDAAWAALAIALPLAALAAAVPVARRVVNIPKLHAVTLGSALYATSPARLASLALLRYLDLATLAARFLIAAALLDIAHSPAEAVVAASVYFLTGLITPSGNLGAREGAVTSIGFIPAIGNHEQLALVALAVTASEIIAALIAGAAGALIVRPDRLLRPPAHHSPASSTSRSHERPIR